MSSPAPQIVKVTVAGGPPRPRRRGQVASGENGGPERPRLAPGRDRPTARNHEAIERGPGDAREVGDGGLGVAPVAAATPSRIWATRGAHSRGDGPGDDWPPRWPTSDEQTGLGGGVLATAR